MSGRVVVGEEAAGSVAVDQEGARQGAVGAEAVGKKAVQEGEAAGKGARKKVRGG
ncbi:hypothetical protein ACQF36_17535 [Streptomyces sp. Marseille-Q5077]|uniref:hypothetical protein n=1 Tax=Streptomyces sp. Marseille-Q5077 TaxID=3418995 RepID=UPI003D092128